MNIQGLNLNLLLVLDALLIERHVSRASTRLGLSQPAVSNALAQLRALLGDPLLVRSGGGMIPTERALSIAGPVHAALAQLSAALEAPLFEPARVQRSFIIATTDFVDFVLVPKLLARLAREAPGVRLQIRGWSQHRVPPTLETGEVDLMIGFYPDVPSNHRDEVLFPDEFVCIVRKDHPRVGRKLDLKTYTSLAHVLVTEEAAGPGVVDTVLAKRGLSRTVGFRTSHFLMVPAVIAATDFVAAISRRVAETFAQHLPLRVLPPPLKLPRGSVRQVWHERTHASPAHTWLRNLIKEETRED
ncbi:MAG: LysR family transcriptional regulator [Pseudomonadota bacterium]